MGHAFVDNVTYYGDPDHTQSPVAGLSSRGFAALRAAAITLDRAAARPVAPDDPWPFEPGPHPGVAPPPSAGGARGTTQVVAGDGEGNLVALITTIGLRSTHAPAIALSALNVLTPNWSDTAASPRVRA